jgi:hypothetical protein
MFRRHIGKETPHDRAQTVRDSLHETGAFRQAHYPKPKRHNSDQAERDCHGGFCPVESAGCYLAEPIVPAANRYREDNEREPDVIQHRA